MPKTRLGLKIHSPVDSRKRELPSFIRYYLQIGLARKKTIRPAVRLSCVRPELLSTEQTVSSHRRCCQLLSAVVNEVRCSEPVVHNNRPLCLRRQSRTGGGSLQYSCWCIAAASGKYLCKALFEWQRFLNDTEGVKVAWFKYFILRLVNVNNNLTSKGLAPSTQPATSLAALEHEMILNWCMKTNYTKLTRTYIIKIVRFTYLWEKSWLVVNKITIKLSSFASEN